MGNFGVIPRLHPHHRVRYPRYWMYPLSLSLLTLWSAAAAIAQTPTDYAKLGWHDATASAYTFGRLGGIGPRVEVAQDKLTSFEALASLRNGGAATFATSQHPRLPFDLAAARLVDGLVVTDSDRSLALWSTLLDHGYITAPVALAPARLYVECPAGLSEACVVDAVKHQRTVVSTGPLLAVKASGQQLEVNAASASSRLLRVELWAHNQVVATHPIAPGQEQQYTGTLTWKPAGPGDWIAVRVVAESGWALSSAFFAEGSKPAPPITTHLRMVFPEIASQQQAGALATIFDFSPAVPGAKRLQEVEMERNELEVDAPVTAVVRIELADGRRIDTRLFDASGVRALLDDAPPNTDWALYEEVLRRCRRISMESRF